VRGVISHNNRGKIYQLADAIEKGTVSFIEKKIWPSVKGEEDGVLVRASSSVLSLECRGELGP